MVVRARPSPISRDRRLVFSRARCSWFSRRLASLASAISGADDLQQVPAQPAQLAGPELAAQGDHLGLGPGQQLGVEVVGQLIEHVDDDGGLGLGDEPVDHPGRHRNSSAGPGPSWRAGQWARPAGKSARVTEAHQAPLS